VNACVRTTPNNWFALNESVSNFPALAKADCAGGGVGFPPLPANPTGPKCRKNFFSARPKELDQVDRITGLVSRVRFPPPP
jgi:hypothetical protein